MRFCSRPSLNATMHQDGPKKIRNRPALKEGLSLSRKNRKIILADRHEPKYQSAADFICDTTSYEDRDETTAMAIIAFFQRARTGSEMMSPLVRKPDQKQL